MQSHLFQCHLISNGTFFFFLCFTVLTHVYSQYIFTSKVGNPFIWENNAEWKISSASTVDDYPFDPVHLPFTFPWFHKRTNVTWISPNGALHFHKDPPCCIKDGCFFAVSQNCNIDNYYDMIAGLVTDFNANFSGTISYSFLERNSNNPFTAVHYSNMAMFFDEHYLGPEVDNQLFRFDFVIYIFSNGKITIAYEKVFNPFAIPGYGARPSLAGLRGPRGQNPIDFYKNEWNTTTNGTYVPHHLVKPNTTLTFWPITKDVCYIGWMQSENIWVLYFTFGFFGYSSSHLFRSRVEAIAHLAKRTIPLTVLYDENSGLMKIPFPSSFISNIVNDNDNPRPGSLSFTFDGENLLIDRLHFKIPPASFVEPIDGSNSNAVRERACQLCHKVIPFYCIDACKFSPCHKSATCTNKLPAVTNSPEGRICITAAPTDNPPNPSPVIYIHHEDDGGLLGLGWPETIGIFVFSFFLIIFSISRIINICRQQGQRRTAIEMSTINEPPVSDTENESFLSQLQNSINGSNLVET